MKRTLVIQKNAMVIGLWESDVIIFTGTTLVNNTFGQIRNRIWDLQKDYSVYGVTAAAVCHLFNIDRICPRGRDGSDLK